MPKSFPAHARVKDHYCCHYLGDAPEYVVALTLLKPQIEAQLPGLRFHVAGKTDAVDPTAFGYVRELRTDRTRHAVLHFMDESALTVSPVCETADQTKGLCLICPEGIDRSLTAAELTAVTAAATRDGYGCEILGSDFHHTLDIALRPDAGTKMKYLDAARRVVGVENEYTVLAASLGKRVDVAKGLGEKLYKKMFPKITVFGTSSEKNGSRRDK